MRAVHRVSHAHVQARCCPECLTSSSTRAKSPAPFLPGLIPAGWHVACAGGRQPVPRRPPGMRLSWCRCVSLVHTHSSIGSSSQCLILLASTESSARLHTCEAGLGMQSHVLQSYMGC